MNRGNHSLELQCHQTYHKNKNWVAHPHFGVKKALLLCVFEENDVIFWHPSLLSHNKGRLRHSGCRIDLSWNI